MLPRSSKKGFTLIEVLIYIVLFSILMGGGFVVAHQLIDNSRKLSTKDTTQEEGNFVMQKFDWALTGVDPTTTPTISGSGCSTQTLSVTKTDTTISPVVIRSNIISGVNYIEVQKRGGAFYPITTANVLLTCLKFSSIAGPPAGITATATINGIDFKTTKYIRK